MTITNATRYLVAVEDEIGQWWPEHVGYQEPCSYDEARETVFELRKLDDGFRDCEIAIIDADTNDVIEIFPPLTVDPLRVPEAAIELGISPATLRVQIHNGVIQATKRGRDNYINRAEVERYAREHLRAS